METFKIGICEPEDFSKKAIKMLESYAAVSLYDGGELSEFIKDKDAVFVRLRYQINDDLIKEASSLKYVCSPTTGLNHINISKQDIEIVSLKGEYEFLSSIRATPEHVFGLSLALLRNYAHAFLKKENAVFNRDLYKGYELFQNKIGIIGLGRVGRILEKYYTTFGADVGYYDIEEKVNTNAKKYNSMEELISNSNIIILAANYTKENEAMLSEKEFAMMQGKYFINAARGELVNEADLLNRIKEDWFKGVAIDVFANETSGSIFLDDFLNLTTTKNIIITPHIGGATYTSMERTEEFIAEKLIKRIVRS